MPENILTDERKLEKSETWFLNIHSMNTIDRTPVNQGVFLNLFIPLKIQISTHGRHLPSGTFASEWNVEVVNIDIICRIDID